MQNIVPNLKFLFRNWYGRISIIFLACAIGTFLNVIPVATVKDNFEISLGIFVVSFIIFLLYSFKTYKQYRLVVDSIEVGNGVPKDEQYPSTTVGGGIAKKELNV